MSSTIEEKVEAGSNSESKVESQSSPPSLHKTHENPDGLKLDRHGLPLIPQPSSDPSDPLNWPMWLKIAILLQVSFLAGLGPLNQAVINPGAFGMSLGLSVPPTEFASKPTFRSRRTSTRPQWLPGTYQTTIAIAFAGVGSFLWVPLANTYGRRPLLLFTTLLSAASCLASGKAQTWNQLIGTRVLNGLGTSSFFTLGAGVVSDCFFLHERRVPIILRCFWGAKTVCRGRAMGIFTVFLTNSAHVAPIPGGLLAQYVNYRWCYYLPGVLDMTLFVLMFFCLPETLYQRGSKPVETAHPILRRMNPLGHRPEGKHLKLADFGRPFQMLMYPSVLLTAFYYGVTFAFASILPSVTSATLFRLKHHFTTSQTGFALGFGTLIGSTLGELAGGLVIDRTMRNSRKKGGEAVPEVRLSGIWPGVILQPVGLLVWGFCWQYKTHWLGPTFGFAILCFAIQIVATVLYSYVADCYKPQMPETAQVYNFTRQIFGMTLGFWSIPMGMKIGFQFMGLTLALVGLVLFLPVVYLMYHGKAMRERLGQPKFNQSL
ncbi:unnamed protein product [Mycena citricolor]|uniref:Major facilitator superfamily (MFS) profile domain-containing protein n=1 Tax=Mycena citricolor TaxID=2018698 RepID=A0AAD2H7Z7_9AGAR|nr:unnamed protein product [Mycena citricolor]